MVNNLSIQTANSEGLLKSVYTVRKEVFVHEQKVDERKEYDQYETSSTHLACLPSLPARPASCGGQSAQELGSGYGKAAQRAEQGQPSSTVNDHHRVWVDG